MKSWSESESFEAAYNLAMTQVQLGVVQKFPRGRTRALSTDQLSQRAAGLGQVAEDRRLRVLLAVREETNEIVSMEIAAREAWSSGSAAGSGALGGRGPRHAGQHAVGHLLAVGRQRGRHALVARAQDGRREETGVLAAALVVELDHLVEIAAQQRIQSAGRFVQQQELGLTE